MDKTNLRILAALSLRPLTAKELVKYLRVPYTTCYRRLNWLVEKGLAKENTARTKEGNLPYKVYTTEIQSLTLHYDDTDFRLNLTLNRSPDRDLTYQQRLKPLEAD